MSEVFDINKIDMKDLVKVEEKENMFKKCQDFVNQNTKVNDDGMKELMLKRSEVISAFEEFGLTNETAKNYYYLIVNKNGEYEKKENKREKVALFIQKFPNLTDKEYIKNFQKFLDMSASCARTYLQHYKKTHKVEVVKTKQHKIDK